MPLPHKNVSYIYNALVNQKTEVLRISYLCFGCKHKYDKSCNKGKLSLSGKISHYKHSLAEWGNYKLSKKAI